VEQINTKRSYYTSAYELYKSSGGQSDTWSRNNALRFSSLRKLLTAEFMCMWNRGHKACASSYFAAAIALGGLCLAIVIAQGVEAASTGGSVAVPEQVFLDLDGNRKTLDDLRGKVLLVNFWTSWCPPCIREMPELETLARSMIGRPFRVVMVNVEEPPGVMRRFKRLTEAGILSLRDPDGRFARDWGLTVYPTSFIVDRDGQVTERFVGPADWTNADWTERFERLLSERRGGPQTAPKASDAAGHG
jgi:thiol-disulfide isomerase/thioredoxin